MKTLSKTSNNIPEIYCSILACFPFETDNLCVLNELRDIGVFDVEILNPKCEATTIYKLAVVKKEQTWELDQALTKMFTIVDECLSELKKLVDKYCGEIYIDIAFYQFGTYPSLVLFGNNMKKIHLLEANISIDSF